MAHEPIKQWKLRHNGWLRLVHLFCNLSMWLHDHSSHASPLNSRENRMYYMNTASARFAIRLLSITHLFWHNVHKESCEGSARPRIGLSRKIRAGSCCTAPNSERAKIPVLPTHLPSWSQLRLKSTVSRFGMAFGSAMSSNICSVMIFVYWFCRFALVGGSIMSDVMWENMQLFRFSIFIISPVFRATQTKSKWIPDKIDEI